MPGATSDVIPNQHLGGGSWWWRKLVPRLMIPHHTATSFSLRFQISPPTTDINPFMRVPSFQTIIHTLHAFTNTTPYLSRSFYRTPQRATVLRSMPNIPFLGALFGSSSQNMADNSKFPVQKTEGEWQAQLSPGTSQSIIAGHS